MQDAELIWLSDQSLAEFAREEARWMPGFRLLEDDTALWVASGTRFPGGTLNCVLPLTAAAPDASRLIEAAQRFFEPLARGFSVFAPTHLGVNVARACEAAGWPQLSNAPGMVLTSRSERAPEQQGLTIRRVIEPREAHDFAEVCARSYEALKLPSNVTRKLFAFPERWLRPHWHAFVVYEHEQPVSAAALLFSHGIAGVYWVATVEEARGRGHAERVMRHIGAHAFDHGARCVVLQASPFGEPIYRKLGYREITRYPWYLVARGRS